MSGQQAILGARNVSKAFFGNQALRDVSIDLVSGRIHALLGENGAGKSTLINVLSGALTPDSGQVLFGGNAVAALRPRDAHRLGIAVVQQELSLAPHLSIAENIGLGAFPRRWGVVDYGRIAAAAKEIGGEISLTEPMDTPVGKLSLGRRQIVEIAKALFIKPRVLILDEPTSSLAAPDVAMLLSLVRRLRDQGVAILYISHRLNEIMDFCDHVTVLKDGAVTADRPLAGLDPTGLVRLMVGRDPQNLFPAYASRTLRRGLPSSSIRRPVTVPTRLEDNLDGVGLVTFLVLPAPSDRSACETMTDSALPGLAWMNVCSSPGTSCPASEPDWRHRILAPATGLPSGLTIRTRRVRPADRAMSGMTRSLPAGASIGTRA